MFASKGTACRSEGLERLVCVTLASLGAISNIARRIDLGWIWKDVYRGNVLIRQIDPLGDTVSFDYDAELNLTKVTDARGNTTKMTYDASGNVTSRKAPAPLSYLESYTYNARNDLTSSTDGRGNTTNYGYDSSGNLTSITRPGNNLTQFGRDPGGTGLMTSLTDPRGKTTSFEYDAQGNLTQDDNSPRQRDHHGLRRLRQDDLTGRTPGERSGGQP